jgi:DNA-binding transcriptional MerR regulator
MFSIGSLSKQTGVKVPTIRYYEQIGLIAPADRTEGNQRRYRNEALQRLGFIKHARELGFSIQSILALIELHDHPDRSCAEATTIAREQLSDVRERIASLVRLESELVRISDGCKGAGVVSDCYVLASLADHGHCETQHL